LCSRGNLTTQQTALAAALLTALASGSPITARAGDLLIRNVRLIDGTGAPARDGTSILVIGGRIVAIGPDVAAPTLPVLDAHGATVIPGLMNMHVHFHFAPGQAQRGDSPGMLRDLNRTHLRAYLAAGVTTVLDAATQVSVAREIREVLAQGVAGPTVLTLGPAFTCPGGYAEIDYKGVSTADDVEQQLDVVQSLGAVGIKVMVEQGFTPFGSSWPIHSPEILEAIVTGARRRQLPIYVHATSEDEYRIAVDIGAHAVMHAPLSFFWGGTLSDSLVERLAATGTYVVTTLSLMDAATTATHLARLDDPRIQLSVPAVELATARDPEADRFAARAAIGYGPRWIPGFAVGVVARLVWNERTILDAVKRSQEMIRELHHAGVPIVVGTDTPGTPYFQYNFHGPTILREMELLAAAGLSSEAVLAAATRVPAHMVGLGDQLGTVEIGKRADMVVLEGDPLTDLGALGSIRWTIKEGVAHSPQEWMLE
jgi:imidazolonepropionase-like amidohydrolase